MRGKGFIKLAGVEMEGGWDERMPSIDSRFEMGSDGSIDEGLAEYIGELRTKPLKPQALLAAVPVFYPEHVNSTCGLHLHMSFRSAASYAALCDDEFWPGLKAELKEWGTRYGVKNANFWSRLDGGNTYCNNDTDAVARSRMTVDTRRASSRYAPVNYCWSMHKTVEVRVLPMFKQSETAVAALATVMNFTEKWVHNIRVVQKKQRDIYAMQAELEG